MITQRNMSISIKICRQGNCYQCVISVVTVLDCPILHDPLKINLLLGAINLLCNSPVTLLFHLREYPIHIGNDITGPIITGGVPYGSEYLSLTISDLL